MKLSQIFKSLLPQKKTAEQSLKNIWAKTVLEIDGNFSIGPDGPEFPTMPRKLIVHGNLDIDCSKLTALPDKIIADKNVTIKNCGHLKITNIRCNGSMNISP